MKTNFKFSSIIILVLSFSLLTIAFTPLMARTVKILKTVTEDIFHITGKLEVENGLDVKGTMKVLGGWETKNSGTIYQAPTDGFVTFFCSGRFDACELNGDTDSSSSADTVRVRSYGYNGSMFPVKKGDYWKVMHLYGGTVTVYWIPLGSN